MRNSECRVWNGPFECGCGVCAQGEKQEETEESEVSSQKSGGVGRKNDYEGDDEAELQTSAGNRRTALKTAKLALERLRHGLDIYHPMRNTKPKRRNNSLSAVTIQSNH